MPTKIKYKLYINPLSNDQETYRAMVDHDRTLELEDIIDMMEFRSSSITKADILAVFEDADLAILRALLDGNRVKMGLVYYSLSIKGNFDGEDDQVEASRHQPMAQTRPTARLQQAIETGVRFEKVEATQPVPRPNRYFNLQPGADPSLLSPGHTASVKGYRLGFERDDPQQGLFLVPVATGSDLPADTTPIRVEEISRLTQREIIFRVPDDLSSGEYKLEVRAIFGANDLRIGTLKQILTVS